MAKPSDEHRKELEAIALAAMAGEFTFSQVWRAVDKVCAIEGYAYRLADRLLQRERKAGRIKFNGKFWTAVKDGK